MLGPVNHWDDCPGMKASQAMMSMGDLYRRTAVSAAQDRRRRGKHSSGRGRLACIVLTAIVAIVLSACSSNSSSTSSSSSSSGGSTATYTLALVVDQTGALAGTDAIATGGAQTWVDEVNASGGVKGHKVALKIFDAKSDPNAAVSAFREAISTNPVVILHAGVSSELASSQSLLTSAKIPVISISTVDNLLSPQPTPWFFSIDATSSQFAAAQIQMLQKSLGESLQGKKIAIVNGVSASLAEIANYAKTTYAKQYGYTTTSTNITNGITAFPQAGSIAATHPNAAFLNTIGNDTSTIAKALTNAGLNIPMNTNTTGASDAFLKQLALPKFYGFQLAPTPRAGDAMTALATKYGQEQDANGASFGMGYALGYLSGLAIAKCDDKCPPSSVESALQGLGSVTVPNKALYGPVVFSPQNHSGLSAVGFNAYDPTTKGVVQAAVISLPKPIYSTGS
jgi:ABC-type branched-subunit amino acid transport system substrate-binding protein